MIYTLLRRNVTSLTLIVVRGMMEEWPRSLGAKLL